MANNITLKENEAIEVTFKYGNVTRSKSKRNPNEFYYAFDCEEGRINASPTLGQLIADNWCGRGGTMRIEKLNNTRFDVEATDPADRIYALDMREWSDEANPPGFVDCDLEFLGTGGAALPPKAEKPERSTPPSPPQKTSDKPSFEEYTVLMAHCLGAAVAICGEDITEQQQKVAVTLFMQADRKGITADSIGREKAPEPPPQEEEVHYDEETAVEEDDDDDLPF